MNTDITDIVEQRLIEKIRKLSSTRITDIVEQRLIEKIRKLSSTRILEIDEVFDFLSQREDRSDTNRTLAAAKLSESAFAKVWDNPEDAVYDDL